MKNFTGRLGALCITLLGAAALLSPTSGHAAENVPHLRAFLIKQGNKLLIEWQGPVVNTMSDQIRQAFDKYKDQVQRVDFSLNSPGGSVKEGERVIAVLQDIKKTHSLLTAVTAGRRCGSMCVFIYAQGQKRLAAPASLWLFHEVSYMDPATKKIRKLDRAAWEVLVDKYLVPAGVSKDWLADVKSHTSGKDYWQSGESLIADNSNMITKALSDENRRVVYTDGKPHLAK